MQLAWLSLAMFLGMTLWFSATAANAAIVAEFRLTAAETAWLTMAVQGGFVIGTLVSALLNLPDVLNPRRLFWIGCVAGAIANAWLAAAGSVAVLVALRLVTGAALALVYPPGMKVAAGWFEKRRGAALGVLIGALTVGSATPHLIPAITALNWRGTLLVASALALAGAAVVLFFVGDGPHRFPSARFDLRMAAAVFRERGPRLACFGYLGHMWELYAMWTWIAAFLAASLEANGGGSYVGLGPSGATFLVVALGALGCWAGGVASDRWGRTALTMVAMALSGTCAAIIGLTFGGSPSLTLLVAAVWGITVIADSAQFSTAITELSPSAYVGTALTAQTCIGFALTMASIWLIPPLVARIGWRWAFAVLAIGPALGVIAMARLRGSRDAVKMAGGRR